MSTSDRCRLLVVILVGSLLAGCALQSGTPALSPKAALTMAERGRPVIRAGDTDADGVLDTSDACPDTKTQVTVNITGCGLFDAVLSDVSFQGASSWLSPQARAQLDELAETLLAFPKSRVQVRAHTDSQGNRDMNLTLSYSRANVVVQYLKSQGVHDGQLQAVGAGETQPQASNRIPEGRQSNRQVDIVTLPDQGAGELPVQLALVAARVIVVSDPHQRNAQRDSLVSPALMAPVPVRTTGRSTLPIMSLPVADFAPRISISGVVEGLGFSSSSSKLSADSQSSLATINTTLRNNPEVRIAVMAHTDDSGDMEDNLTLSRHRAQSVAMYLVKQGVAASQLEAEGYGEMLPLVQNITAADRAINRRVEIRLLRSK